MQLILIMILVASQQGLATEDYISEVECLNFQEELNCLHGLRNGILVCC